MSFNDSSSEFQRFTVHGKKSFATFQFYKVEYINCFDPLFRMGLYVSDIHLISFSNVVDRFHWQFYDIDLIL